MKNLTLGEFRDVCTQLHPKEFILHSDNQSFAFGELGVKFDFRFSDIHIYLNPDIISLTIGKSRLQINKIKAIYERKLSPLGRVFDIICTGFLDENNETVHTIILQ